MSDEQEDKEDAPVEWRDIHGVTRHADGTISIELEYPVVGPKNAKVSTLRLRRLTIGALRAMSSAESSGDVVLAARLSELPTGSIEQIDADDWIRVDIVLAYLLGKYRETGSKSRAT